MHGTPATPSHLPRWARVLLAPAALAWMFGDFKWNRAIPWMVSVMERVLQALLWPMQRVVDGIEWVVRRCIALWPIVLRPLVRPVRWCARQVERIAAAIRAPCIRLALAARRALAALLRPIWRPIERTGRWVVRRTRPIWDRVVAATRAVTRYLRDAARALGHRIRQGGRWLVAAVRA